MSMLVYQYSLGILVFAFGLFVAKRQGYIGRSRRGLGNLLAMLGVLAVFFFVQSYLQLAPMSEAEPRRTEAAAFERSEQIGAPIDYAIMVGYFLAILAIGTWFGRRQRTLSDFFFGGQRFAWWLITFSLIATVVGSYSFVKYSQAGFRFGLGSAQTYLNDWMWLPLLLFGWLPILYFSRVTSIPEYFERRFDRRVRGCVTVLVLVYLVGYVGVNLFTMGKVLNLLLGWHIWPAAAMVATISAIYVTAGGQTSVIMTDLFQGIMLLGTGLVLLFLGLDHLGGFDIFWNHLPRAHRLAFPNFNQDPSFPSVGIFWQDGIANTAMFYFLNQGVIMRFLSARSVADGRRAMYAVVLVLMPLAAIVVGCGGWIARALVSVGALPSDLPPDQAFFVASELLSTPGIFGLILAALTAALMSTVDTLITAVAAIVVNDIYRPLRPAADEAQLLRVARFSSIVVALVGIAMVPIFMSFKTIYEAHGAFTAAVTPPLVVALMLSVFWPRFTRAGAIATLVGGMMAIICSLFVPEVITPFAHGVPMGEAGTGFLAGMAQYKFMRACFGIVVCLTLGVSVSLLSKPEPRAKVRGLVIGTLAAAIHRFKGIAGHEGDSRTAVAMPELMRTEPARTGAANLPSVEISSLLASALEARVGDLVYVRDRRWWLGGLRSSHAVIGRIGADDLHGTVSLGAETFASVIAVGRENRAVAVDRLY